MSAGVTSAGILALLGVLLAPWWWPMGRALLEELAAASREPLELSPRAARPPNGPPVWNDGRVPPNRVLAFQGVRRRIAARRRWEAGFGRRGL
jgi:hypothetical protein